MRTRRVYLAGTISADPEHLDWRSWAAARLDGLVLSNKETIVTVDPVRFQNPQNFVRDGLHDKTVPSRVFVARDVRDVQEADALLLVFRSHMKHRRQSIGTWCEMMAAGMRGTPTIVVTDDPDVRDHPFVEYYATYVALTLSDGIDMVITALGGAATDAERRS